MSHMVSQLSVRMDRELAREVRALARREGISLNKAALKLLRRGAGLERESKPSNVIGDALDDLIGTWSRDESRAMRRATKVFEKIDHELWK